MDDSWIQMSHCGWEYREMNKPPSKEAGMRTRQATSESLKSNH